MNEKDAQAAPEVSVPPLRDDSYDPATQGTTEPVGGSPIIDKPPFDGGDDDER